MLADKNKTNQDSVLCFSLCFQTSSCLKKKKKKPQEMNNSGKETEIQGEKAHNKNNLVVLSRDPVVH